MSRRVVITGAGSGIGLAIAEVFYERGARIHIGDVSQPALDHAIGAHANWTGTQADVGDRGQAAALIANAKAALGGLDVLVNNAGIGGPSGPVEEIDPNGWDETLRVNLSGMYHCIRAAAPIFKAQRAGVIINISTASVTVALPNRAPYVASKAGVQGLTRMLARELGPFNVRSNAILPGLIDNPRGRALLQKLAKTRGESESETEAHMLRFVSMRTWIDPREIGAMAWFLASDDARHVTGQCIGVCGNAEWEE